MRLDDLKAMDRDMITPAIAAKVLNCDPHFIRVAASQRPEVLGFPVSRIGCRTKIPRLAFIAWCEGGADSRAFVHTGAAVPEWTGRPKRRGGGAS